MDYTKINNMRGELKEICEKYDFEIVFDGATKTEDNEGIYTFQLNSKSKQEIRKANIEELIMWIGNILTSHYENKDFLLFTKYDREIDDYGILTREEVIYNLKEYFKWNLDDDDNTEEFDELYDNCDYHVMRGNYDEVINNDVFQIFPVNFSYKK